MVKQLFAAFLCIGIVSSCAPTKILPEGSKVLLRKYKNIDKFDPSVYLEIDPNYFYRLVESYSSGKHYKEVINNHSKSSHLRLQFYEHGYVRILSDFVRKSPDPEISGMRGVIYKKGEKIQIDTQAATDVGSLYKETFKVIVEGDRIYLVQKLYGPAWLLQANRKCNVYQKAEKVPEDWKKYKPNW